MRYQPGLFTAALLEKQNITSKATNKEHKIEDRIKYLNCLLLRGANNLRYKKLRTELKNNYIMGLDGYLQDLSGVMKLLNNYITESRKTVTSEKTPANNIWG